MFPIHYHRRYICHAKRSKLSIISLGLVEAFICHRYKPDAILAIRKHAVSADRNPRWMFQDSIQRVLFHRYLYGQYFQDFVSHTTGAFLS